MIDWLTTQIAVGLGAIILMGAIIGYYTVQMDNSQTDEAKEILRALANKIESLGSINGNTTQVVTFDEDLSSKYYYLKPTIGDSQYSIQFYLDGRQNETVGIYKNTYRIEINIEGGGNNRPSCNVNTNLHLWQPAEDYYSVADFNKNDLDRTSYGNVKPELELKSGSLRVFNITRKMISISGDADFFTFIFPASLTG